MAVLSSSRSRRAGALGAAAVVVLACAEAGLLRPGLAAREETPTDRPVEVLADGFVSSRRCRSCHPEEYASWHASFHRTMTQLPAPETVRAPFDGVELTLDGDAYRLERRGEEFWADMPDPEWEGRGSARVERPIALITGSHHFQVFWYPTGRTRKLGLFPLCYRLDEGFWMPLDSAFLFPPEASQQTETGRWNRTCNKCHTTQGRPRILGPDRMETTVAEFGIACESCHSPAETHVESNRDPLRRYRMHLSDGGDPTIVHPETVDALRSAEVCGQCHAITRPRDEVEAREWRRLGSSYRAGDELEETRAIGEEGDEYFWSDGVIRVSGREYNGLLHTPCFEHRDPARGIMTCLSCHEMHRDPADERPLHEWTDDMLKPGMRTNLACTACHDDLVDADALERHTGHAPASSGSECMNCHMPYTSWGLLKAMRTHQVTSPSAQESLATGRPNACNLCHLDRTLAWTAENLEERHGIEAPEIGKNRRETAASILWLLTGDAGQRALMAWAFGWAPAREASGTGWMAPYLGQLLEDPYDAVRFRAYRSLCDLPGFEGFAYDFVAPEADLEAARERALAIWSGRTPDPSDSRQELLIDEGGSLQSVRFRRLLSRRDDRPVALQE